MTGFITIAVFSLPSEMVVAKARLESEDITCRVLDELTVQTYNFISNAVGGIKLQVLSDEIPRAKEILEEGGFIAVKESETSYIERQLQNPGTIGKIKTAFYLLFGIIAIIVLLLVIESFMR